MATWRPCVTRADRYLMRRMLPLMGVALAITMMALLVERLLRLLDLIAGYGVGVGPVVAMVVNLVPHYVGLALPAAFSIGILGLLSRLSRDNELDALESSGWSLRRIGAPFVVASVLLVGVNLLLFGVLQPYSRYAYREVMHQVLTSGWDGRVEEGVFLDLGGGMTLSAATIDPAGRVLGGIFLVQKQGDGEIVMTARRGVVQPDPAARVVRLILFDGVSMPANGGRLEFDTLRVAREFDIDANPFRPRGGVRELTFSELRARARGADGLPPDPAYGAELHGRLVRSVSLIGVALLSVPLGVARKRSPTWPRIAIAIAILAGYNHLIQFVASLAELGRVEPAPALWGLCGAFLAGTLLLYVLTPGQGARSPFQLLLRAFSQAGVRIADWRARHPVREGGRR